MTEDTPQRGPDAWRKALAAYRKRQRAGRARGYRRSQDPFRDVTGVRAARRDDDDQTNEGIPE